MVFNESTKQITEGLNYQIDGIIYIKTEPSKAIQRIAERDRQGEDQINIKYIQQIHQRYEEWLGQQTEIPQLTVVNTCDLSDERQRKLAQEITKWIDRRVLT